MFTTEGIRILARPPQAPRANATCETMTGTLRRELPEDFYFNATSPYTEVNLEQSQAGWAADLSYDHVTGKLAFVNGAMVADVQLYPSGQGLFGRSALPAMNLPGENDCAHIKPDSWRNGFTATALRADVIVSCIFTAEKDFGYLVIGHDSTTKPVSYFMYSYTWVR